ncbi:MAG: Response regulator receiver, CheY-like protein [Parcubacteria group bacterium GW2011_GWA2_47_16]|nr:MAG: Response regulator receiver, CheY-like protein [Parcubacteria group bacterium GW2011_GWA2_47_16]
MKKILVIEDDVFLGDVLLQKLKNDSYEVALCRDGAEGLKKISDWKPDLILLDIILPSMNGYEILEAKVKNKDTQSIPVIVISNSGQPVEISRLLSLGVKDYLVKAQFEPDEVLAKVRAELGKEENRTLSPENRATAEALLSGKKILWVEDDKFLSDIIARKLSHEKCVLVNAVEGEEAIRLALSEQPDIILLDILLPGIDGFEILNRLKADPKTKAIPVILLSNLGQKSDMEKGRGLGASRFLIKATVTLDEIISEIKAVIFGK